MADNHENSENMVTVESKDELDDLVDENEKVLVDFFADWCGPCQMMEPTIEELTEENDLVVAEVDVDSNQKIAADFNVRSVPTYIFYDDGDQSGQLVGYQDKEDMEDEL